MSRRATARCRSRTGSRPARWRPSPPTPAISASSCSTWHRPSRGSCTSSAPSWGAPDEKTFAYLEGRPRAPQGERFERAVARWRGLRTDAGARYDAGVCLDASTLAPQVTWGTSPGMVTAITGRVPDPAAFASEAERRAAERALEYMDLKPGTPLAGLQIDRVFLGSCTNARI